MRRREFLASALAGPPAAANTGEFVKADPKTSKTIARYPVPGGKSNESASAGYLCRIDL